ncbi:MAG: DUF2236 domain-containing protein [Gammaproteobacteria bacterium]|jgi:hypothetical protein|nr:DUF2236 domain-containing protein [Gammaproteobacteria bacterium]
MALYSGSSAEFALNPVCEWLFFTGKLPADPVGRFFTTTRYMKELLLAPDDEQHIQACQAVRHVHSRLEEQRGKRLPDASYRDVLFMGLTYSLRAHRIVFGHKVEPQEIDGIMACYANMARHMQIPDFPGDYEELKVMRRQRLARFRFTENTQRLLDSYRRALGPTGYLMLRSVWGAVLEKQLLDLLDLRPNALSWMFRHWYAPVYRSGMDRWLVPPRVRQVRNRLTHYLAEPLR